MCHMKLIGNGIVLAMRHSCFCILSLNHVTFSQSLVVYYTNITGNPALAEPYFGKLLGELTTEAHGVRGTVYAGTDQTLYIREFYYDGEGPGRK